MGIIRLLAISIFAVAISSCTKKGKSDYGLDPKETLRINIQTEPPSINWIDMSDVVSSYVADNIIEGLIEYDYADPELKLVPALAESWKSSKDAKTWTFNIRKGVKWTDGVEFTPQNVLDGWEMILNPKVGARYAYFLFSIKNAKLYNEGKISDFSQVGAKINDKGQIVVELEGPQSYFPYLLTHHSTYPVRKDLVQKYGDKWHTAENIVTLGPYYLKKWEHDKALILERNENYYGEKPKIKNIIYYMIPELSTGINLMDANKLDVQMEIPASEIATISQRKDYVQYKILSMYYYGFNVTKPPMDNVLVRKAIVMGIDRKQIVDMLNTGQTPLSCWVPAGMFGHEDCGLQFNPVEANKLLDQAGYKDRTKMPNIEISFNTSENHQRIAENVQAQLKKNLGMTNVELKNEEWKVFLDTIRTNPPHVFRYGWTADYPDPDNYINLMTSYSENNNTKWKNKEYDKLSEKGALLIDKAQRRKIYLEAQKLLTEKDVAVFPIYSMSRNELVATRVANWPKSAVWRKPVKKVSLK